MIERVLAPANIQCATICEKWLSPQPHYRVGDGLGVVWPQERKVARLAEVHFNSGEFVLEIDFPDTGRLNKGSELIQKVMVEVTAQVRKIHLRFFHTFTPR
jgi:hypothetical protein